jgi:hypothetical protein
VLLDAFDHLLHAAQQDAVTDELLREVEAKVQTADLNYLGTEIPQAAQDAKRLNECISAAAGDPDKIFSCFDEF